MRQTVILEGTEFLVDKESEDTAGCEVFNEANADVDISVSQDLANASCTIRRIY